MPDLAYRKVPCVLSYLLKISTNFKIFSSSALAIFITLNESPPLAVTFIHANHRAYGKTGLSTSHFQKLQELIDLVLSVLRQYQRNEVYTPLDNDYIVAFTIELLLS